jgi:hypothetical protein
MKKTIIVLACGVAALTAVCVLQSRKLTEDKRELASVRSELAANAKLLEAAQDSEQLAGQRVEALLQQTEDLSTQLRAQAQANVSAGAARTNSAVVVEATDGTAAKSEPAKEEKNGFGEILSKMMQDPAARKFMRDQQRMMVDQLYTPLVRQMGLSAEETTQFKNLLADNMMRGTESASSLLASGTNRTESLKSLADEQKNSEEQLKAMLGESRYALYQDYQVTVGERAQLNQFRQMGGSENPLSDTQVEQLLGIIKQERQAVGATASPGLPGSAKDPAQLEAMLSNGEFEKTLETQETVNQRVFQRANEVLAADQMEAFGRFQTNQLQMMRFGMSMAKKMFSSKETAK